MPNKKKTRSSAGFLIVAFICAAAVYGVAQYVKAGHQYLPKSAPDATAQQSDRDETPSPRRSRPNEVQPKRDFGQKLYAYRVQVAGRKTSLIPEEVQAPDDEDARVYVVNKFLNGARITDPNARLLSIDIDDGVAKLNFSKEMNTTFGTDDESMLLNGILTSLGQFPEIKSALFFADKQQIESFGNVDLTTPQDVIRGNS